MKELNLKYHQIFLYDDGVLMIEQADTLTDELYEITLTAEDVTKLKDMLNE